jgi:hypothetical protein
MIQLTTDEAQGVVERIDRLVTLVELEGGDPVDWAMVHALLRDARRLLSPPPPAPEMAIVTGFPHDDPSRTDGDPAEYDGQPLEGLQCPHEECRAIVWAGMDGVEGVRVVERGERWNTFGYGKGEIVEHEIRTVDGRRQWVGTGRMVEHRKIYGDYGDAADMHTVGYECASCDGPVRLPPDVDEEGM